MGNCESDVLFTIIGTRSVVDNRSNCMNPIPVMPIPYQSDLRGAMADAHARVCVFQHLPVFGMGFVHDTLLIMSPNV